MPNPPKKPYTVKLSKRARKGLEGLAGKRKETAESFLKGHMLHTPLQRIPGKLKQLHGRFKAFMQFDIDDSHRIVYQVDKETNTIYVDHIGGHPKL